MLRGRLPNTTQDPGEPKSHSAVWRLPMGGVLKLMIFWEMVPIKATPKGKVSQRRVATGSVLMNEGWPTCTNTNLKEGMQFQTYPPPFVFCKFLQHILYRHNPPKSNAIPTTLWDSSSICWSSFRHNWNAGTLQPLCSHGYEHHKTTHERKSQNHKQSFGVLSSRKYTNMIPKMRASFLYYPSNNSEHLFCN